MPTDDNTLPAPLTGVRVLDLTRVLAGPFATMLLADLGADVIKVERPDGGDDTRRFGPPFRDGESTYFLSINRGKRSITCDLKSDAGQEVLRRLIASSDVLIENFRPGVLDRLGFSAQAAQEINPRLIYASISGFGHAGLPEHVKAPGYDLMVQSLSGVASLTGPADAPPSKAGVSIGDLTSGLYAVHGILAALYEREKTGKGRRVDIAMLDGLVSLLAYQAGAWLLGDKKPTRMGNQHPSICPFEAVRASDGYLAICCGNDRQFIRLAAALERQDLCDDPRFSTNAERVVHRAELIPILQALFEPSPLAHWLPLLNDAGIPCAPMQSVDEALEHPQLAARGMLGTVDHSKLGPIPAVGCPVQLEGSSTFNSLPAPLLGEHTDAIMAELGL